MQLFLSMGVEINGVVKKVSFITLSKEKVILLIKKSDSLRIFLFRYKNIVFFFAQEDMPYDRYSKIYKAWSDYSAFFVHSFTSFTIVLDALHRTFVDLLISFIYFFMLFVCLVRGFFLVFFLFTHFLGFFISFFFFGFCFVTVSSKNILLSVFNCNNLQLIQMSKFKFVIK